MMGTKENGKSVEVFTIPAKSAAQKTAEMQKKFWHIDREMLRFKLHFFLFMGGLGCSAPYLTIFAKNKIDISASSMAAILTAQQFLFIFTKPLIGYIADYFNKLKAIICVLTMVQTVSFFLLLTIPKIQREQNEEQITLDNTHFFNSYEYMNSSQLFAKCSSSEDGNLFPKTLSYNHNSEEIEFCFLPLDYLSKLAEECSNQEFQKRNLIDIQVINNNSESSTFSRGEANSSLSISLYSEILSTCKVCCKLTEQCQNIECEIPTEDQKDVSPERKCVSDFETYQFWLYALLTTIAMGCANGLFTLSDTACCESVEKSGAQFGRQRLFGAIGWGLLSPIAGLLNDYTNDFTAAWILMAAMFILSLLNILKLDIVKPTFSQNLLKDIGAVLRSTEFLAYTLCVLLNGVGTGVLWYYLVWYLTTIGGSRFLCGMVQFVQCFVGEIPFMFFSGRVIKKIGHFNVITLALLSYCIRFFWYGLLRNPWLVLMTEGLSGLTYGLFYTAVASYAKLSSKPGTEATTQAVLFTAHEGIGAGIGCVVGGLGFDYFGGRSTFFFLSTFAGCSMILSIILHLCIRGRKGSIKVTSDQVT